MNKWALLGLPYPGLVTACQFLTTAVVVSIAGTLKYIDVEPLRKDKLMQMAPINIVFYLAIFTNGQVLKYATVETFIAFRSLTPLLVSALDTVVRGEPAPSRRTLCCLCAIALGAASYAHNDARITPAGYAWGVVYLSIIVTEMVYAKHVTATIQLSTWSLVLYQNTIALFLWPFASLISGEFQSLRLLVQTPEAESEPLMTMTTLVPLLLSCVLAIGISFSAWGTRSAVSATQFTVLGVACKLATVAINVLAWSHHASIDVLHRRVHPRVGPSTRRAVRHGRCVPYRVHPIRVGRRGTMEGERQQSADAVRKRGRPDGAKADQATANFDPYLKQRKLGPRAAATAGPSRRGCKHRTGPSSVHDMSNSRGSLAQVFGSGFAHLRILHTGSPPMGSQESGRQIERAARKASGEVLFSVRGGSPLPNAAERRRKREMRLFARRQLYRQIRRKGDPFPQSPAVTERQKDVLVDGRARA